MSWNYRALKRTTDGSTVFGIYEAYTGLSEGEDTTGLETYPIEAVINGTCNIDYTEPPRDHTKIQAITMSAVAPFGDTEDELRQDLLLMLAALDKPVLDYDTAIGQDMI